MFWLKSFLQIIYGPGPYGPGAYGPYGLGPKVEAEISKKAFGKRRLTGSGYSGAGRYSDVSFLRKVFNPNGFYSERFLFRKVVFPKDFYSERFSPKIRNKNLSE